jgi:hypothetical protein
MAIAAQLAYNDGVDEGITIPGTWSGTATATLGIGKQNGFIVYCDAKIQAVAIYSTTLDATQVAEVSAAMAAL